MKKDLKNYKVTMTHLGFHNLIVQNYVFSFISDEFEVVNTFDGTGKNMAGIKVEQGDSIVSPFGVWKFQLEGRFGHVNFSEFNFAHYVDIELDLIGNATFLHPVNGKRF